VETVIEARGVTKHFRGVEALRGVSFSVRGPRLVGVLGPNGAGKTTLLEILEGLSEPTSGEVSLFGEKLRPGRYPRRRVGVVLQREFALDRITVGEYADLFAAIYGVPRGDGGILDRAQLAGQRHVAVERLSGGEAQRLFIAAASVHGPDLLFRDEPTAHLDPASKLQLGEVLRGLAQERTVLLTTHDLREADRLCDDVVFLVGGEVKAAGPREELIAAVPADRRHGGGIEDAFFHFCDARLGEGGRLA
jgi:ABC-2 type transport system ATP-binding protein